MASLSNSTAAPTLAVLSPALTANRPFAPGRKTPLVAAAPSTVSFQLSNRAWLPPCASATSRLHVLLSSQPPFNAPSPAVIWFVLYATLVPNGSTPIRPSAA